MTFNDYLNEIQKCIDNKLFIASLMMSLTLPDICGAIVYGEESDNGTRYRKWYKNNVSKYLNNLANTINDLEKMPWLSGDVIYSLRNFLLHQGIPNIKKKDIKQEENKIDKFRIDFSDSHGLTSSSVDFDFSNNKTISYEINAKYLSIILLASAKSFYVENKDIMDCKYKSINTGFERNYLWTN